MSSIKKSVKQSMRSEAAWYDGRLKKFLTKANENRIYLPHFLSDCVISNFGHNRLENWDRKWNGV